MNIAFYIDEMNLRGVANSTFNYAKYNRKILKNNSYIFYNKKNFRNKKEIISKFQNKFLVKGINNFKEIDDYKKSLNLDYIYTQKSGNRDKWISKKIHTLVHAIYPQNLGEIHGHKYVYVSDWLSKSFSNNKISILPYIVELDSTRKNLRKKLKIKKNNIVLGCHGGDSSFNLKFAQDSILDLVKIRKDIFFVFLNIKRFCKHPRIIFLKGSSNENYKKKFLNTCDVMIYGRSLGESFGLACGEFAHQNKLIISYKYNRHRAHLNHLFNKNFYEYGSKQELKNIVLKLNKSKLLKKIKNKYSKYNSKYVMNVFKKVFLKNTKPFNFSFTDYFFNYLAFIEMASYYFKHKLYNHYYNYIIKKII